MLRTLATLLFACLGSAAAHTVDSVTPESGAFGTPLVIAGSGFGALNAKPKVFLVSQDDGKTRKLKVLEWTDTEITAEMRKLPAGLHVLNVQPKGKGTAPVAAPSMVTVELPSEPQFTPEGAGPGEDVTMVAQGLGTKKGSIKVGGVKAKVLSWIGTVGPGDGAQGGMVVFKLGKKTPAGMQTVSVKTVAGEALFEQSLDVGEPDPGGGGPGIPGDPFTNLTPGMSFLIDGAPTAKPFSPPSKTGWPAATTNMKVRSTSDNGFTSMELRLDYQAPASDDKVKTVAPPQVHVIYTTLSAIYSTTLDPSVGAVIPGASATCSFTGYAFTAPPQLLPSFGGSFSATLVKVDGVGPDTIAITDGFFWTVSGY